MIGNRGGVRVGLIGILLLVLVAPLAAQRTTFTPALGLRYAYSNNVEYVVEPEEPDSSLRVYLALPVSRTWQKSNLNFKYLIHAEKFSTFDEFDHVGHRMSLGVASRPTVRSSVGFGLTYQRTQDQGGALTDEADENVDPTFTQRIWQDRYSASLNYSNHLSQRWVATVAASAGKSDFERVTEMEGGDPLTGARNRSEFRTSLTVTRELSALMATGIKFAFQRFDLDTGGVTDTYSVSAVVDRQEAERLTWGLGIGGYRSERSSEIDEGRVSNGVQGSFRLKRQFKYSDLVFFAGHGVNAGGARLGTSVNSNLRLSLLDSFHRRWGWSLFARWGRRDPQSLGAVIDTYNAGAGLRAAITRKLAGSLTASYGAQSSDDPDAVFSPYYRAAASLVWTPLGTAGLNAVDFF